MRLILFSVFLLLTSVCIAQTPFKGSDYIYYYQVGVGKTNGSLTNSASWLEVGKDSTNKGFRMPRVVDTVNIASPVYGLLIYQIKDNTVYYRDKFGWKKIIDGNVINQYLLKSDSTTYYPYWSNPRNYISVETDPVANAKTIRWIAGTGINVSNGSAQVLATNPVATISAQNTTALWNANQIQGIAISAVSPTNGQFLQYNGAQYVPTNPPPSGTVNSVGLSLPGSVFNVSGSPVTNSGTLTGTFSNQLSSTVFAAPAGITGIPSFRSLLNADLPNSGVASGIYGSDSTIPVITVNSKGIITSAFQQLISYPGFPGTQNYVPKYGPGGLSFINSQLFDNGTNVGIGTTSPISKLHVAGTFRSDNTANIGTATIITGTQTGVTNFATVQFLRADGTRNGYVGDASSRNHDIYLSALNGSNIRLFGIVDDTITTAPTLKALFTNDGHYIFADTVRTGTAIFRVAGSGQFDSLSIGTPTPSERLHVNGNIIASAPAYSSGGIAPVGRNITTGRFETIGSGGIITKLTTFIADASNTTSGTFSSMYPYNIPANTLNSTGEYITADYGGKYAANGNTKGLQIFVSGTGSGSSTQAPLSGETWTIRVVLIRTGSTTGRLSVDYGRSGSGYVPLTGLDYTAPISFNLWGLGDAAGDVTASMGVIEYHP